MLASGCAVKLLSCSLTDRQKLCGSLPKAAHERFAAEPDALQPQLVQSLQLLSVHLHTSAQAVSPHQYAVPAAG